MSASLSEPRYHHWPDNCATQQLSSPLVNVPPVNFQRVAVLAAIIGASFFLCEHSLQVALADAYTQTADEMQATAGGGNTLRRLVFLALGMLGGLLLVGSKTKLHINLPMIGSIGCFFAICYASYFWAIDPSMALRRLIVLSCVIVGSLGLARYLNLRELALLSLLITVALSSFGVLNELRLGTFRPWSGDFRFAGTVHPNTQGMILAVQIFSAAALWPATKSGQLRSWLVAAGMAGLLLLVLTKSRTSTAAVLVSLLAILLLQTKFSTKLLGGLAIAWCGAASLLLLWLTGIDPKKDFRDAVLLGRAEESDTLSGRHLIWPEMWDHIAQRPLLGHGFESFWTADNIDSVSETLQWGVREAHNGYLDVMLSVGQVGLLLGVVMAFIGLWSSARGYLQLRDSSYALPFGLIVFALLNSFLESGMVNIMLGTFLLGSYLLHIGLFAEPTTERKAPSSSAH